MNIEAVKAKKVVVRRLEERPLVPLEIDRQNVRKTSVGVEIEGVKDLDPHVDVTVRLRPHALRAVKLVRHVRSCVDWCECVNTHGQSRSRTALGHSVGTMPRVFKRAMTQRSRPKPRQAV